MAKLDRLGWVDGISMQAFGVKVGLRVNDPATLQQLIARMPPGSQPISAKVVDQLYSVIGNPEPGHAKVRRFNLAYWNLDRIARTRNFADFLDAFESHVQLTVAEHATRYVFVHAGVVGWNGQAIVIPGRSHSGKTTLVKELIRAGATYYSDEYAVIDRRGRVHPYARKLGLREPNSPISKRMRAEDLGATVGEKPLRIGLLVSTKFADGALWRPRALTRGQGVLELLANTVSARTQPELALAVLPKSLEGSRIIKSRRSEASEIVRSLLNGAFAPSSTASAK